MTSNLPIVILQRSSALKFFSLGLLILGFAVHDYTEIYRQVLGLLFAFFSVVVFFASKIHYKLYADKIIRKTYRTSTTLHINATTICYEYQPKTTKKDSDKPSNEFFMKTEEPKQQFKIFETSWKDYSGFKKEVEKVVKKEVDKEAKWQKKMSSKQKKIFHKTYDERVAIAIEELIEKRQNTSQNIGIGIGAIISLIGLLGLLRIIILRLNFIETVSGEPFGIVLGILVMAYFAMFDKGYD
jgi:hypothetical protein